MTDDIRVAQSDVSKTERLLWYISALTALKQAALQVGNAVGTMPAAVVRDYHGHDLDSWIPPLDEEMPFNDQLWDSAVALCEASDAHRATLDTYMLHYWHHYEAFVRNWPTAITGGGTPSPIHHESRLCKAVIDVRELERLDMEKHRLVSEATGVYKRWYIDLMATIFEGLAGTDAQRQDPREVVRKLRAQAEKAQDT